MGKEKVAFIKMRFPKDMYYNDMNVPLYKGGEVVEVPEEKVSRWLKRGGVLITDEVAGRAPVAPIQPLPETPETPPVKIDEPVKEDEGDKKGKSEKTKR
jgi:hypothetical protein